MGRAEKLGIGFDDAPRKLLDLLLRLEYNHRAKSFFLAGLYGQGVGASAVLRATAELLKSGISDPDTREHFGKIIHVDCSLCKNRRAMQRAIAKELNLGHLMPMFDKQDEDDDFRGIAVSSRVEIQSIGSEIYASLRNERFLMIFHYEGEEDIDLGECGIPNPEFGAYATGKLLWSGYGRFQLSESKGKLKSNSAYFKRIDLYGDNVDEDQLVHHLLHKEAAEVIDYIGMHDVNPAIVLDCFFHLLVPMWYTSVDYEWDTHACNYWICDGILQGDRACEVGSALYGVIQTVCSLPKVKSQLRSYLLRGQLGSYLRGVIERSRRWLSISFNQQGKALDWMRTFTRKGWSEEVFVNASSYFLTFGGDGQLQLANDMFQLANDMFQLASNLRVLKLCKCSF